MSDAPSRRPAAPPPGVSPRPRRTFRAAVILLLFAVAVAAAAIGGWRVARETAPHRGPIVLISIDTLRADHLPAYGYTGVATPNIDALVRDGVIFDRAYAHSPQTLPSHATMLTGRLPFEHGVRDNVGFTVPASERTLAQLLRGRGFSTGAAVSSYVLRKETGLSQGFQVYDAELPAAAPEASLGQVRRDGADTVAAAEKWLTRLGDDQRFFLFLHLYEPHRPYAPPARFAKYQPYDAEIAYADELVGRLLAVLEEKRWYDDATIVLLADHGEGLGDHGEQEHGLFVYDETIRVPLVIKLPDGLSAGRRVAQPVQHIDIVPTIMDFVRAPAPGGLRGRSLRPILENAKAVLPEQAFYAEALYARFHFGWSELYALTDTRFRYIKAPREELYDLATDPRERENVAVGRAQTASAMRGAIDRLIAVLAIPSPASVSDEDRERFAALGYVGTVQPPAEAASSALPDPKDMVPVLEAYRGAVEQVSQRNFAAAIAGLHGIVAGHPEMVDVWQQLGALLVRTGRIEEALAAYRKTVELRPEEPSGLIATGGMLLRLRKLDEAAATADLAVEKAAGDARALVQAEELHARIALARKDAAAARLHAERASTADPTFPLPQFVEGRLLYDEGRYEEALAKLEEALTMLEGRTPQIRDLELLAGDTLGRLDRYADAERHFRQELKLFPTNLRAYASLALLFRAEGRADDVKGAVDELLRAAPTPEGYGLAAHVLTIAGDRKRAEQLRADGRRRFKGDSSIKLIDQ